MLVVAHRLSTVRSADLIYVLHRGEIVEQGTHAFLLARGGRYAALWRAQAGEPSRGGTLRRMAGHAEPAMAPPPARGRPEACLVVGGESGSAGAHAEERIFDAPH